MIPSKREVLNKFFVETFNKILLWEEQTLREASCRDLSMKELHAIEAVAELEENGRSTMSQTAQRLSISVGALTTAVNVLVTKGYLERNSSETDRRVVKLSLTEKGREAEESHRKFHDEMVGCILNSLDEGQQDSLITSLELLSAFFEQKSKKNR